MRKLFLAVLSLIAAMSVSAQADYRKGEVIVKFKSDAGVVMTTGAGASAARGKTPSAKSRVIDNTLKQLGAKEVRQLMPLTGTANSNARGRDRNAAQVDLSQLCLMKYDSSKGSVEEVVKMLSGLSDVEFAEPNYIYHACVNSSETYSSEPLYGEQWGPKAINLPQLWDLPIVNTKRPVIAILDTGVDINHPDLAANIWTNEAEKGNDEDGNGFKGDIHGWNFIDNTPDVSDVDGHGTHCAGIAAAVGNNGVGIAGANPNALIMPVKVLDDNGGGQGEAELSSVLQGLDYAIANGADIISMSFSRACPGRSTEQAEKYAMEKAAQSAILVASAGNEGVCMNPHHATLHGNPDNIGMPYFPAAYTFVIGVMATDESGKLADFSCFDCKKSPSVTVYGEERIPVSYEVSAPGDKILSTLPNGEYGQMSGTSMSCPMVAGAISSLLQRREFSSNAELITALSLSKGDNDQIDLTGAYNVTAADIPQHKMDEIFTKQLDGVDITFRVTGVNTVQIGDGSSAAINSWDYNDKDIVIPETVDGFTVTNVGSWSFYGVSVKSITLPTTIGYIGDYAFENCGAENITIPDGVTEIGERAMSGCMNLTSLYLPKSVMFIAEGVFASNNSLKEIKVAPENTYYDSRDNCNAIIETSTGTLLVGTDNIPKGVKAIGDNAFIGAGFETITIPEGVERIGANAFYNCRNLKEITIPEGVTTIGSGAFLQSAISSVIIPKSVTYIGDVAFSMCDNLNSFVVDDANQVYDSRGNCNALIHTASNTIVQGFSCSTLPSDIQGIGSNCFYYCHGLTSLFIPKTLTEIGYCPIIGCENLNSIVVEEGNPVYDSRDNCNAIIETATNTFVWGNHVSSIPNGVKTLASDCFWGTEINNRTIVIPEGVETLSHGSLNISTTGNEGNVIFSIPSTIKTINGYTCQYGFKALYCYATEPIVMTQYAFNECGNAILYVPKGCKEKYAASNGWSHFKAIREMNSDIPEEKYDINCDETINATDITDTIDRVFNWSSSSPQTFDAADTNGDGSVTISDIIQIVNQILNTKQ